MGFLDDSRKKLGDAVDQHGDRISDGLDRAAAALDERTGGRHRAQIDQGLGKAKEALDGLDGRRDDIPEDRPRHGAHRAAGPARTEDPEVRRK